MFCALRSDDAVGRIAARVSKHWGEGNKQIPMVLGSRSQAGDDYENSVSSHTSVVLVTEESAAQQLSKQPSTHSCHQPQHSLLSLQQSLHHTRLRVSSLLMQHAPQSRLGHSEPHPFMHSELPSPFTDQQHHCLKSPVAYLSCARTVAVCPLQTRLIYASKTTVLSAFYAFIVKSLQSTYDSSRAHPMLAQNRVTSRGAVVSGAVLGCVLLDCELLLTLPGVALANIAAVSAGRGVRVVVVARSDAEASELEALFTAAGARALAADCLTAAAETADIATPVRFGAPVRTVVPREFVVNRVTLPRCASTAAGLKETCSFPTSNGDDRANTKLMQSSDFAKRFQVLSHAAASEKNGLAKRLSGLPSAASLPTSLAPQSPLTHASFVLPESQSHTPEQLHGLTAVRRVVLPPIPTDACSSCNAVHCDCAITSLDNNGEDDDGATLVFTASDSDNKVSTPSSHRCICAIGGDCSDCATRITTEFARSLKRLNDPAPTNSDSDGVCGCGARRCEGDCELSFAASGHLPLAISNSFDAWALAGSRSFGACETECGSNSGVFETQRNASQSFDSVAGYHLPAVNTEVEGSVRSRRAMTIVHNDNSDSDDDCVHMKWNSKSFELSTTEAPPFTVSSSAKPVMATATAAPVITAPCNWSVRDVVLTVTALLPWVRAVYLPQAAGAQRHNPTLSSCWGWSRDVVKTATNELAVLGAIAEEEQVSVVDTFFARTYNIASELQGQQMAPISTVSVTAAAKAAAIASLNITSSPVTAVSLTGALALTAGCSLEVARIALAGCGAHPLAPVSTALLLAALVHTQQECAASGNVYGLGYGSLYNSLQSVTAWRDTKIALESAPQGDNEKRDATAAAAANVLSCIEERSGISSTSYAKILRTERHFESALNQALGCFGVSMATTAAASQVTAGAVGSCIAYGFFMNAMRRVTPRCVDTDALTLGLRRARFAAFTPPLNTGAKTGARAVSVLDWRKRAYGDINTSPTSNMAASSTLTDASSM